MKITSCLFAAFVGLSIAQGQQQVPPTNESLAYARLIAAHRLPTVTHGQCLSAQSDWLERDKADQQNGPYWFEKISTEELARDITKIEQKLLMSLAK